MSDPERAAAEAARRRVKRAAGLLRDAARDLASITDGQTVLGVSCVTDEQAADAVRELIALGVARHGAVDVVITARTGGRTPTTAP